ncbi:class II aldolase/adducin family protein [uncultured Enterovirga sp.]|uniref:class II aldolase/adducin family protein n=1 Tax=uncultured Enterovirga sp. TaxID=2026352 RepID=UPI0035CA1656
MSARLALDPASAFEPAEWALRCDLAAAYRLIARFGMDDLVYTHLSMRLPGPGDRFLINPYGWMFDEITASSLVVVDAEGMPAKGSDAAVNPAGFVIHSAIHRARADAHCVMHTHTLAGMAVAALDCGLLPVNQMSMEFHGQVALHPYEGIADDLAERERLVADLGAKPAMILANHGLLTVGRTVAEAFYYMYYLEQACRIQVAAMSTGAKLSLPSPEVCEHAAGQFGRGSPTKGQRPWAALRRRLDREAPDYRD